jgi:outer membrane protein assembly factor BamB
VYAITIEGDRAWAKSPELDDGVFRTDGNVVAALQYDTTAAKVEDQGLYVPSTDTKLYCLNPTNGHVKWQFYAGVPLTASPTVTADLVYQRVAGEGVAALPKKTGDRVVTPKWVYADGVQVVATDAKNAYVLNANGSVSALNKADGKVAFTTETREVQKAVVNPDAKNPTVFALTRDKRLVAYKPVLRAGVVGELAVGTVKPSDIK